MMDVIIHNQIEALEELIPEWKKLKDEFRNITMFQDVEWMKNWWKHKRKSKEIIPYIVEIKNGNETIGIIPLYISDKKFANVRFRILHLIEIVDFNYLIPILKKSHSPGKLLENAINKIYKDKKSWDCIHWEISPKDLISTFFLITNC